ncbi:cyclin-I-like [Amphiura filiformis]|uniref:cyclin-I-like n=1 Tax=Amphiura filiformis TaxID=82378 RepID=UPI003B2270F2
MLHDAIDKEGQCWKPLNIRLPTEENLEIHPYQRDEMIEWLLELNYKFHFSPETFVHSVSLLDRFLMTVKARPKYLRCIAFSCFFLAAKLKEEDEAVPATVDLVRDSECGCTVSEVLRMERIVLDKLKWDINCVTSLEFLQIFHAIVLTQQQQLLAPLGHMTPARHLNILTSRLCRCLTSHKMAVYPGSTLALSLFSLELEVLSPDWLALTFMLQRILEIDNQELIHCREQITTILEGHPASNTVYIISTPTTQSTPTEKKPLGKQVEKSSGEAGITKTNTAHEDMEDIADSIKRLYNEDASSNQDVAHIPVVPPNGSSKPSSVSCSTQILQDKGERISPIPPLQSIQVT